MPELYGVLNNSIVTINDILKQKGRKDAVLSDTSHHTEPVTQHFNCIFSAAGIIFCGIPYETNILYMEGVDAVQ